MKIQEHAEISGFAPLQEQMQERRTSGIPIPTTRRASSPYYFAGTSSNDGYEPARVARRDKLMFQRVFGGRRLVETNIDNSQSPHEDSSRVSLAAWPQHPQLLRDIDSGDLYVLNFLPVPTIHRVLSCFHVPPQDGSLVMENAYADTGEGEGLFELDL